MQFKYNDEAETDANVDMTPLIDVVFILLIFFILSASFQQSQTLDIDRPSAQVQDNTDKTALMVSIDSNNTIWFQQQIVAASQLQKQIKQARLNGGQSSAIIDVDKSVDSGKLIEVIDKIRIAGVDNVAVATHHSD
ncbi:ExbD/TolR family protein [Shewanella marina]|uniref:ExbD/TolR family protein n=1 Tax=Shewanella marina TaxID=487319 RepID=UPI0004701789|nr:biopolymer transporter ExbD [Shewanella marina]